jgi:S-adenosyl-L-methionine hydrolase (adenosine-forming)
MKRTPVITLLTDFGLRDEYVGVMKGVILSINPRVQLVDISHSIERHDIRQAALVLNSAFRFFPKGSIHLVVVDPGVGGERRVICLEQEGHLFLAPDNGVLTMVIQDKKVRKICAVSKQKYFLKPVSDTFHGRDIFAPVAAHLSKGLGIVSLGKELGLKDLARLKIPRPFVSDEHELVGEVMAVDRFGNLITNISQRTLKKFQDDEGSQRVEVRLGRFKIKGVAKSYDSVKAGAPTAIIGSRNLLEVSLNQGDAREHFKARIGQGVRLRISGKAGH